MTILEMGGISSYDSDYLERGFTMIWQIGVGLTFTGRGRGN
jgi:hypothetical protein